MPYQVLPATNYATVYDAARDQHIQNGIAAIETAANAAIAAIQAINTAQDVSIAGLQGDVTTLEAVDTSIAANALFKADNLSGLASLDTARDNLDLTNQELGHFGYGTSGNYYFPNSMGSAAATVLLANGTFRASSFFVPKSTVINRLFAEVSTVGTAGALARLGLFARTGELTGSLVAEGVIDGTVLGTQEIAVSATLARGWYFIGAAGNGAPGTSATLRAITLAGATPAVALGTSLPSNSVSISGVILTGVTGALPASTTFAISGAASPPRVGFKVA